MEARVTSKAKNCAVSPWFHSRANFARRRLDDDEGLRLFRFGQSLTQGADPERRPRASGAVGESDSIDRPGSDGS